ncbi:unnamed protein product [Protopolystoma xenopodis]|uniref:Uncharacterized protein n=1 Tax=Protopolystoma xenopodis TaxID=117903 RepID=A0A3S5CQ30_9PLAT|nr:unnamed protein product [Protopolystoma xenopodis]
MIVKHFFFIPHCLSVFYSLASGDFQRDNENDPPQSSIPPSNGAVSVRSSDMASEDLSLSPGRPTLSCLLAVLHLMARASPSSLVSNTELVAGQTTGFDLTYQGHCGQLLRWLHTQTSQQPLVFSSISSSSASCTSSISSYTPSVSLSHGGDHLAASLSSVDSIASVTKNTKSTPNTSTVSLDVTQCHLGQLDSQSLHHLICSVEACLAHIHLERAKRAKAALVTSGLKPDPGTLRALNNLPTDLT